MLDSISNLMGYISFFENFVQIVVLLFAWVVVLLAFFILAIQLFVTLIEFKLTTLAGFVLIPFGLFGKTAFAAERVLGNVISSGIKVLVLAVIVGIGSTLFSQFTAGFGGAQPTIEDAMTLVLAALSLLGLGIFGPGIANGLVSGGPQLGAGAAIGTGLAAGGVVAAGAGLAAGGAGLAGGAIAGAGRGGAAVLSGASAAYRSGGLAGVAEAGGFGCHEPVASSRGRIRRQRASERAGREHVRGGATRLGAAHEARPDHSARRVGGRPCGALRRSWRQRLFCRSLGRRALTRQPIRRFAAAPADGLKRHTARLETNHSISGGNYPCSDDLPFTTGACPNPSRPTKKQRRSGTSALDLRACRPRIGA